VTKESKRVYQSEIRQQQAEETRQRIADAARQLFLTHGYDGTTIDAVAANAGVAPQTVYAVFRSKKGIFEELVNRARFGAGYQETVRQALDSADPVARLRFAAKISRQVYESESAEVALLRAAEVIAPKPAKDAAEPECRRMKSQKSTVAVLVNSGLLRPELNEDKARDILWALTSREFYSLMVTERGWNPADYEAWLADMLISALLRKMPEAEIRH
jgi:AcrR family transcriptional regulator